MEVREPVAKYLARPAFKQTEVGVIPEDWVVQSLKAVTDPKRPISYGIVQTGPSVQGGIRCLRVVDVSDGRINKEDLITTSHAISNAYKRTVLQGGDLVMPLRGKVGDVASIDDELIGCNLTRGLALIAILEDHCAIYLKHFLASEASRARLVQAMNGSALQEIPIAPLRAFQVSLPPTLAEQQAIAEALTDADALIEALEQLLAKKRQIKRGAMQELLTGQKRLPGFAGEWDDTTLGAIADRIIGGGTPSRNNPAYWNGNIPWMTVKDFACFSPRGTLEYITHEGLWNSASNLVPGGTLIVSTRMALGKAVIFDVDVCINQDLKAIHFRQDVDPSFMYFWFQLNEARIVGLGSGSTVMGISLPELKRIQLQIPEHAEQTAIATILSDMDAEIAAVEAKLVKARGVKQGMMQELLTGRIRLV